MGAATACSSDTTNRPERGRDMGAVARRNWRGGERARDVRTYQRRDLDPQAGTSPAGLTTQVGFYPTCALKAPELGVNPSSDGPSSSPDSRAFFVSGWIAGSSPAMTTLNSIE